MDQQMGQLQAKSRRGVMFFGAMLFGGMLLTGCAPQQNSPASSDSGQANG